MIRFLIFAASICSMLMAIPVWASESNSPPVRGVYGGVPSEILQKGAALSDYGINAVWIGSGGLTKDRVETLRRQGARVFAEFNTMHESSYLKEHPDAAPIGEDGRPCPPPDGWQGVCPTHPGYRTSRMTEFRKVLTAFAIDGVWLDYHHSHASWEQAAPNLPDTCFCPRCLELFQKQTLTSLPDESALDRTRRLLGPLKERWVSWRCGIFTDWVREFDAIRDEVRPGALLGTFHCPWSNTDFDGALRDRLAIDLKAQARYIDVFSPMVYHARFGHVNDPAWIGRQVRWLGEHLGLTGDRQERIKIWPIVQLADWGERVEVGQIGEVIRQGTAAPASGAMVFHWSGIAKEWPKAEAMRRAYRGLQD